MGSTTPGRTCRCGHGRDHKLVIVDADHGVLGYVRLMIGGTPIPRKVKFRCSRCGEVFDESEELAVRQLHV